MQTNFQSKFYQDLDIVIKQLQIGSANVLDNDTFRANPKKTKLLDFDPAGFGLSTTPQTRKDFIDSTVLQNSSMGT